MSEARAQPVIFAPPMQAMRLPAHQRLAAGLVAAACIGILVIAASLTPDPAGYGREPRLGLAPCGLMVNVGLPCMSCGMTTSFSHAVRLELHKSAWVQPMGLLLVIGTCWAFWCSAYAAATGRPVQRLLQRLPLVKLVLWIAALAIAAWGWKILLVRTGLGGTNW